MCKYRYSLAMLLMAAAISFPALAQEQSALDIRTTVQKEETVVSADGTESKQLVPAEKVVPGDEVVYTVRFSNLGSEPAENVVITNPLPAELSYVSDSATGPGTAIEFSVDGGATYGDASSLRVAEPTGERAAQPEDFTHIRWVMKTPLPPGGEGVATFRAILN